jgi:glutamine amidotransferase
VIALIDYRAGNLTSVRKAFAAIGADLFTPSTPDDLDNARGIVVPGVGHFGATAVLDEPWRQRIRSGLRRGTPLLGICLGLQWLFDMSEEAPGLPGLGVLAGSCSLLRATGSRAGGSVTRSDDVSAGGELVPQEGRRAPPDACAPLPARLKVPHVGWNALDVVRPSRILRGIDSGEQAYFTHSYVAPITSACVSQTTHGEPFASVVESGLVFGAQFHPEKSGEVGLTLLRNFLSVVSGSA